MPNQPAPNTVTASFTLPRELFDAVETESKRKMTNKSDIIRRALMNYLSPAERAKVEAEMHRVAESLPSYGTRKKAAKKQKAA